MPQLLCFSRNRHTDVEFVDDQTIRSSCRLQDTLTDAFVEITATLPDLEIAAVRSVVERSPRVSCRDADQSLQKAVGIRIGAGMTEIIKGLLEESVPCQELIFMLEECCHGVILTLTRDVLEKAPADEAGKRAFFSKMVKKNIRLYNRCAAFAPGSSVVEGIDPPK